MLRMTHVATSIAAVLIVWFVAKPADATGCTKCSTEGTRFVCVDAEAAGAKLCRPTSQSCYVSGICSGQGSGDVRVGRINVFTASAGSYAGFPDTATPSSSSISDTVSEIASLMGTSTANISLRAGGFIVGPQDEWTLIGTSMTSSKGFTLRTSVSGSDVTYDMCSYDGSTSTSVASEVLAGGDLLLAHATINSVDVIITIDRADLSSSTWLSDGTDMQTDYWDDVDNNVVNEIALGAPSSPPSCN